MNKDIVELYIEEEKYKKIKKELNIKEDYFSVEDFVKLIKLM